MRTISMQIQAVVLCLWALNKVRRSGWPQTKPQGVSNSSMQKQELLPLSSQTDLVALQDLCNR